jgi:histidine triad (HIT) family protein
MEEDCAFCSIVAGKTHAWKVLETDTTLAFLDTNPVVHYHTLIIPKAHYNSVFTVPADVLADTMETLRQVCLLYKEKLGIKNLHVFNNSGLLAQQTVFHLHFHILPRYPGDGNDFPRMKRLALADQFDEMIKALQ